jgi:hypothetical protein
MKRISIAITLPDNGGISFFGPLSSAAAAAASKSYPTSSSQQRMYISANQDPLEVGKTLMAMLADLQMSDTPIKPGIAPEEIDVSF